MGTHINEEKRQEFNFSPDKTGSANRQTYGSYEYSYSATETKKAILLSHI
jgi:hypothetical protein